MRFTLPILAAFLVADGALGFTAAPGVSTIRSFKPSLRTAAGHAITSPAGTILLASFVDRIAYAAPLPPFPD